MHVEGCDSGEERKEFSFTFYDFDGHGKITKDVCFFFICFYVMYICINVIN